MGESTARSDQAATEQSSVDAGEDTTNLTDQDPSADCGEPEPIQFVANDTVSEDTVSKNRSTSKSQSTSSPSRLDTIGAVDDNDADMDSGAGLAAPPRLDRQSAIKPLRHVKFTGLDDDDQNDEFGPTLAAWLADYQTRQNGVDPRRDAQEGEYPTAEHRENMADPSDENPIPSSNRYDRVRQGRATEWSGKAQVALTDMLETMPAGRPHGRIAAGFGDEPERARGSRFAAITMIASLAVGVGVLAVIAAARTSGVDVRLDGLVTEQSGIVIGRAEASASGQSLPTVSTAVSASLAGPPAAPSPATVAAADVTVEPTIKVQPTRIISPSMGIRKADAGISIAAEANTATPKTDAGISITAEANTATPNDDPIVSSRATIPAPIANPSANPGNETKPVEKALAAKPSPEPKTQAAVAEKSEPPAAKAAATKQTESDLVRIASIDASSISLAEPNTTVNSLPGIDLDQLIARAGKLLEGGNVVAARLLFERAAQAGDARGARGVGATYDPIRFAEIGVQGIDADPGIALAWYSTALNAGNQSAAADINQLKSWMNR